MKKLIALLLALVMVLGLFAGCGKKDDVKETEPETIPEETEPATDPVVAPESALEILETIWANFGDAEKFPVMGGDMANMVADAPGNYSLEDTESLSFQLLVPAEQIENIDAAASMFHGMNLNNFTCGVFHVTGDVQAFAEAMNDAVMNNQWMCGFPEQMVIASFAGDYVLVAFGLNDAINPLITHMGEAYAEAEVLYNETIG